jgi:multicomponent Na+:H+ antiporter subunit E
MITRAVLVAWLTFVWVALWGDVAVGTAVAGAVVGITLVTVFPPERKLVPVVRPLALGRLAAVFTWRLVVASAVVAWEVLTPRNRINEGIVAVPVFGASDFVITVVANAVSLTPGTLTLDIDQEARTLYVHVLHLHDVETVRREVRELEELVIHAFGDAATIAAMNSAPPPPPIAGGSR